LNKERGREVPRGTVVDPPRPASHSFMTNIVLQHALLAGNPRTPLMVPTLVQAINMSGASETAAESSYSNRPNEASNMRRRSSSGSEDPNERTPLLRPNESSVPSSLYATSVQSETSQRLVCDCLCFGFTLS
jgi:hypothetical protein